MFGYFSDKDWIGPLKSDNQQILNGPFYFGFSQKSLQLQRAHTFQAEWKVIQVFCLSFSVQKFRALATYIRMIGWSSLCLGKWSAEHNKWFHINFARTLEQIYMSDNAAQLWNSGNWLYLRSLIVQAAATPAFCHLIIWGLYDHHPRIWEELGRGIENESAKVFNSWRIQLLPTTRKQEFICKKKKAIWEALGLS